MIEGLEHIKMFFAHALIKLKLLKTFIKKKKMTNPYKQIIQTHILSFVKVQVQVFYVENK